MKHTCGLVHDFLATPKGIVLKGIVLSVLVLVLLALAKLGVEHSSLGHRVEMLTFELLQRQLPQFRSGGRLEVVVVDIYKMVPVFLPVPPDPLNPRSRSHPGIN